MKGFVKIENNIFKIKTNLKAGQKPIIALMYGMPPNLLTAKK